LKRDTIYIQNFFITALMVLLLACSSDSKPPAKYPDHDKMAWILKEMQLVDVGLQQDPAPLQQRDSIGRILYRRILQAQNVDSATFYDAYNWYVNHPKQLEIVYEKMIDKLSMQSAQGASPTVKSNNLSNYPPQPQRP
jgi:hypothetical protein